MRQEIKFYSPEPNTKKGVSSRIGELLRVAVVGAGIGGGMLLGGCSDEHDQNEVIIKAEDIDKSGDSRYYFVQTWNLERRRAFAEEKCPPNEWEIRGRGIKSNIGFFTEFFCTRKINNSDLMK